MKTIVKAICIKDFHLIKNALVNKGEVHSFEIFTDNQNQYDYDLHLKENGFDFWLSFSENDHEWKSKFSDHFMLLSEYRELRLNKLLDK